MGVTSMRKSVPSTCQLRGAAIAGVFHGPVQDLFLQIHQGLCSFLSDNELRWQHLVK